MPWRTASNGSASGRFIEWCRVFGTTPLTCTIFDPTYFGSILRNHVSHISPTRFEFFIMGTTSTSVLKSHTGATQALTGARASWFVWRESKIVHYYRFFSVVVFWHKANSAHFYGLNEKNAPQSKIYLQPFLVRVNITHHEGEFFCFVSCVLQGVLKSRNQKWIGWITRADLVAQCVIRGYWLISWGCLYFEVKDWRSLCTTKQSISTWG